MAHANKAAMINKRRSQIHMRDFPLNALMETRTSLPDLCALFCVFLIAFLAVLGDHIAGPAAAIFQGDIARHGGGERAQAIDDDILHGIGQGIAAYQHLAVAGHEFLHVQAQQAVKGKFIDFPYFI